MKLLLALVALIAAPVFAQSAVEFKGLQAGASIESMREKFPDAKCAPHALGYGQWCRVSTTWANLPAAVAFGFDDSGLGAVSIKLESRAAFFEAQAALVSKYGNPSQSNATQRPKAIDAKDQWKLADATVTAQQSRGEEASRVTLTTDRYNAALIAAGRAMVSTKAKDAASDM